MLSADEDTACDALHTLADLSLMMPETATDTGGIICLTYNQYTFIILNECLKLVNVIGHSI